MLIVGHDDPTHRQPLRRPPDDQITSSPRPAMPAMPASDFLRLLTFFTTSVRGVGHRPDPDVGKHVGKGCRPGRGVWRARRATHSARRSERHYDGCQVSRCLRCRQSSAGVERDVARSSPARPTGPTHTAHASRSGARVWKRIGCGASATSSASHRTLVRKSGQLWFALVGTWTRGTGSSTGSARGPRRSWL